MIRPSKGARSVAYDCVAAAAPAAARAEATLASHHLDTGPGSRDARGRGRQARLRLVPFLFGGRVARVKSRDAFVPCHREPMFRFHGRLLRSCLRQTAFSAAIAAALAWRVCSVASLASSVRAHHRPAPCPQPAHATATIVETMRLETTADSWAAMTPPASRRSAASTSPTGTAVTNIGA